MVIIKIIIINYGKIFIIIMIIINDVKVEVLLWLHFIKEVNYY